MYASKITINEDKGHQSNLLENIIEFSDKSRPRLKEGKEKKKYFWNYKTCLWRLTLKINSYDN